MQEIYEWAGMLRRGPMELAFFEGGRRISCALAQGGLLAYSAPIRGTASDGPSARRVIRPSAGGQDSEICYWLIPEGTVLEFPANCTLPSSCHWPAVDPFFLLVGHREVPKRRLNNYPAVEEKT